MTTHATGMRRLLKLADILFTADAQHRKSKEPTYDQTRLRHDCGTPACALGHWASNNRRRWEWEEGHYPVLRHESTGETWFDATKEFAITYEEADELFEMNGCGRATTGKEAARYIRGFVKRKQREHARAAA